MHFAAGYSKMRLKYFFHKVIHWEYWPQWLVYAPITPVLVYYFIRARSIFFNTASNPDMEYGGYLMESKFTIHQQLPANITPATIKVTPASDISIVLSQKNNASIGFPCYCKPNIGGKGLGVKKITSDAEIRNYHQSIGVDYLIQEAIPYEHEVGIFYSRLPGSENGKITGIVAKKNMIIVGDGQSTFRQLINATPRYYYQRSRLYKEYAGELDMVIPKGMCKVLSEVGNHARGSMFIDVTYQNNPALENVIDAISKKYNTFYFGRYDVRYRDWKSLCAGKHFALVELNGAGSEPTHIYDPAKSLWQAWKIIIYHFDMMYKIANAHHKKGVPYLSLKQGLALNKAYKKYCERVNQVNIL
jgi:hypothetical protein